MISEQNAIDQLERSVAQFVGELGAMKGIDANAYADIQASLHALAKHYRGQPVVSRRMVLHVYGLIGLMLGVVDRYGSTEGPKLADKAAELEQLILACFSDD